jgi:hypothetical protein
MEALRARQILGESSLIGPLNLVTKGTEWMWISIFQREKKIFSQEHRTARDMSAAKVFTILL